MPGFDKILNQSFCRHCGKIWLKQLNIANIWLSGPKNLVPYLLYDSIERGPSEAAADEATTSRWNTQVKSTNITVDRIRLSFACQITRFLTLYSFGVTWRTGGNIRSVCRAKYFFWKLCGFPNLLFCVVFHNQCYFLRDFQFYWKVLSNF